MVIVVMMLSAITNSAFAGGSLEINRNQASSESLRNLEHYPAPAAHQKRVIIHLPSLPDGIEGKLEVQGGKLMSVDCNYHVLNGSIKNIGLDGWDYPLYSLEVDEYGVSPLRICTSPEQIRFVPGPSEMIRYNSDMPVVLYMNEDVQVRYHIWTVSRKYQSIQELDWGELLSE